MTACAVVPEPAKKSSTIVFDGSCVPSWMNLLISDTGFGLSNTSAPIRFLAALVAFVVVSTSSHQVLATFPRSSASLRKRLRWGPASPLTPKTIRLSSRSCLKTCRLVLPAIPGVGAVHLARVRIGNRVHLVRPLAADLERVRLPGPSRVVVRIGEAVAFLEKPKMGTVANEVIPVAGVDHVVGVRDGDQRGVRDRLRGVPHYAAQEVVVPEYFVEDGSKMVRFRIRDRGDQHPVLPEKSACGLQPRVHHVQPVRVEPAGGVGVRAELFAVAVELPGDPEVVSRPVPVVVPVHEVLAGVVRRVDVDELHPCWRSSSAAV